MAETVTPELLEVKGYTKNELCYQLAKYRPTKKLPRRTLDQWLNQLRQQGITLSPNNHGLFEDDDLKLLSRLTFWLARKQTISNFAQMIKEELKNASAS